MAIKPSYKIEYEGKDVTRDLSELITSISFTDTLEGKAGSIEIKIADPEKKFLGGWFPKTNDKIHVWMGNDGETLLDAQKFWVDEFEHNGNRTGIYCDIKAMSTEPKNVFKGATRKQGGKSLSILANKVASDLGLTMKGDLSGTIFGNQNKSDLAFLMQQCKRNGYILKVEAGNLVVYKYSELRNKSGLKLSFKDVTDWGYVGKAEGRFSKCIVNWFDVKKKTHYTGSATLNLAGGATATLWEEVDGNDKAQERAKNWLEDRNKKELKLKLTIPGDVRALAGVPLTLSDAESISGKYMIGEATHTVARSDGYVTEITIQK